MKTWVNACLRGDNAGLSQCGGGEGDIALDIPLITPGGSHITKSKLAKDVADIVTKAYYVSPDEWRTRY